LNGAIALVTGASGDIGQAISRGLLRAGARVLLVGRRPARLAEVDLGLENRDQAESLIADLTRAGDIERLDQRVSEAGRLDVLVLGSGIYERSHDSDALVRQFAANVQGPYALLRRVLPLLIQASGQIVFINSTQGLAAAKDLGQYAATQHAMKAIADSLRDEVNPLGVRVVSVFLGRTATERQETIFAMEQRPYRPETLIQPQDVADLVIALLRLGRTAEVTNVTMRPMQKSY
jgi:NADP-dependent 3-hydroxy acid dehydrogenase YdfG